MELSETIGMMQSAEYKERFKAEYHQLKIRYNKLDNMLIKAEAGVLGFRLDCPIELLKEQLGVMRRYLQILHARAQIEEISLE
jgi:hypothetical protein